MIRFRNLLMAFTVITLNICNAAQQPHVLFIAIDDLRPDLGCYGNAEVKSPNIDQIASQGTVFQRAYCQQSICGPSRLSIMTGMYPDTLGVWGMSSANRIDWRKKHPGLTSLTEQFRKHGYKAIGFGKIYDNRLGLDMDHSWDSFEQGWKSQFANPSNTKKRNSKGQDGKPPERPAFEAEDVPDEKFTDGSNTALALKEIAAHDFDQPLLLAVGLNKPHLPFVAPKKYWDLYDVSKLSLSDRRTPPVGHTEYLFNKYKELFTYAVPNPVPESVERELIHGYYACISYVDAQIGKLVKALKAKGVYDNTMVVLWGDHGFKLGDFGEWAKHTNLEVDAKVPLIIRSPDTARKGNQSYALVELVDVMPTMCELAGLAIPSNAEGISLVPAIKNPDTPIRDCALTQYPMQKGTMTYSIRTKDWRYHETRNKYTGKFVAGELYDLSKSHLEDINLFTKHPVKVQELQDLLNTRLK